MTKQQKVWLGIAGVLVLLFGIFWIINLNKSESTNQTEEATTTQPVTEISIKDFGVTIEGVNDTVRSNIETIIYKQIIATTGKPDTLYTGTIRDNKYPPSSDQVEFLVDVEAAQRTFLVSYSKGSGPSALYVNCPAQADLIYKDDPCVQ